MLVLVWSACIFCVHKVYPDSVRTEFSRVVQADPVPIPAKPKPNVTYVIFIAKDTCEGGVHSIVSKIASRFMGFHTDGSPGRDWVGLANMITLHGTPDDFILLTSKAASSVQSLFLGFLLRQKEGLIRQIWRCKCCEQVRRRSNFAWYSWTRAMQKPIPWSMFQNLRYWGKGSGIRRNGTTACLPLS